MKIAHAIGALAALLLLFALCSCTAVKPQGGGQSATTLGGTSGPTTVTHTAPENPQTPSTTTVEKTTTREFAPAPQSFPAQPVAVDAGVPDSARLLRGADSAQAPALTSSLLRESVTERATTQTGAAQKDTVRELGARLSNLRGVLWVGVLLLVGGPIVGWKLGWFTNGCLAGGVGLLLIILSTVIPGNEAWFGLGALGIIPLVSFVYYRAHHDARATHENTVTPAPALGSAPTPSGRPGSG